MPTTPAPAGTADGTSGAEVLRAPVRQPSDPLPDTVRTTPTPGTPSPETATDLEADTEVEEAAVDREQADLVPSGRYVAAGVLSIVALALAVAIAVVAQPRRRKPPH